MHTGKDKKKEKKPVINKIDDRLLGFGTYGGLQQMLMNRPQFQTN